MSLLGSLGRVLGTLRSSAGLSQEKLAELSRLDKSTVQKIEAGVGNPTVGSILSLVEALKTTFLIVVRSAAAEEQRSQTTQFREPRTAPHSQGKSDKALEYRYGVVIERTADAYTAYCPDLPGCVAVGATRDSAAAAIRKGMLDYLNWLHNAGRQIPAPTAELTWIDIQI